MIPDRVTVLGIGRFNTGTHTEYTFLAVPKGLSSVITLASAALSSCHVVLYRVYSYLADLVPSSRISGSVSPSTNGVWGFRSESEDDPGRRGGRVAAATAE